jgi:predicted short-subunit dehydrogenase-like oxidoreductase (DUF2520 family)
MLPRLVSAGRTGTGRYFIDTGSTSLRFAVIGAGRLGASMALALQARGAAFVGFTAHSPAGSARALAWLGTPAQAHMADLVALLPDVYFLTVPDQALPQVAEQLGRCLTAPAVVAHTSGATSVDVLRPCAEAGATTLVFHPLQTFSDPLEGWKRFAGAAVAITPSSPNDRRAAQEFGFAAAHLLGARPFLLPDDRRTLYHAAATLACNYLVTLEHQAERLFILAGLPAKEALALFLPLVESTLHNVGAQGTIAALTGPLSRGDAPTIAGLCADAPDLLPVYRALGLATLDLVEAREDLDEAAIDRLRLLLDKISATAE